MDSRRRRTVLAALMATATLGLMPVLAACGSDDTDGVASQAESVASEATDRVDSVASQATDAVAPDDGTTVEIPADPSKLAFQKTTADAPAGQVTLRMPNPSQIPHNIAIADPVNEEGEVVGNGGVSEVSADLEAGSYTYYCSVPGHRQAGMEGTLTVR